MKDDLKHERYLRTFYLLGWGALFTYFLLARAWVKQGKPLGENDPQLTWMLFILGMILLILSYFFWGRASKLER